MQHQGMAGRPVLAEAFGANAGAALWLKRAVLVVIGVAAMAVAAKIKIPVPPSPVPITLQTFVLLSVGAAYGARLGFVTMFAYLLIGAAGFDIFTNSQAGDPEKLGLTYMLGGTGGYLLGYLVAVALLGAFARRGWDRSVPLMALAMLLGTAAIYVLGVGWLAYLYGWDKPILEWGLYPFLIGDAMKLALAAVVFPLIWRLVGDARI